MKQFLKEIVQTALVVGLILVLTSAVMWAIRPAVKYIFHQDSKQNVVTDRTMEKITLITIKTATYTMYDCGDVYIAQAIDSDSSDEMLGYLRGMPQCKKIK